MKRILFALLLVAAPALGHDDRISLADLPTCNAGSPSSVWVLDSVDDATCDPEQTGTAEAHCCCSNGTWAACSSGSGGSGDITDVWSATSGNVNALTAASGDSLDAGSADSSSPATRSTSLPGTCSEGQLHQDTDSGGSETYVCTASNTWTKLTTASDIGPGFAAIFDRYLAGPPASPATPDDEFNGSLGGSWTVVSGGSGTVDPQSNSSGVEVYDLSTRSGFILIQVGNDTGDDVLLRQDYTLPDGSLVVAMVYPALTSGGNAAQCGIGLNDNDTAPTSGNTMEIILDAQAAGARVLVQSTGATSGNGIADDSTGQVALAITRVDAGANKAYAGWASFNGGTTWVHVDTAVHSATLDNLWLFCDTRSTHAAGQNDPVFGVDWLRGKNTTNLYTLAF